MPGTCPALLFNCINLSFAENSRKENPGIFYMNTAVVILNWNGKELLQKFLPGVIRHSANADIIIADNGSDDGSVAMIESSFPEVKILRLKKNAGFAGGYNAALSTLQADYYILLNSDVEVTAGWLDHLIHWMEHHHETAACQPKILSFTDRKKFEHAGASGGFIDKWGYPFCRGRMFATLETDHGQYDQPAEVFWASGACMCVRASVFQKLNGFDESFFAHMEEIDLCWRMKRAGYAVYCVPESAVYHLGGGTLPKRSPHKTYLNFRNNMMMIHKNTMGAPFPILLTRCILDFIAAIKFLSEGYVNDFLAVLKAYLDFYGNIKQRNSIRNEWKRKLNLAGVSMIYKNSIVAEYFFRKKRKFSALRGAFTKASKSK